MVGTIIYVVSLVDYLSFACLQISMPNVDPVPRWDCFLANLKAFYTYPKYSLPILVDRVSLAILFIPTFLGYIFDKVKNRKKEISKVP